LPDTVASPLEQQINGVEGMLYMFSQATAEAFMTLTITFDGHGPRQRRKWQVQNQYHRHCAIAAESPAPGVTTEKTLPGLAEWFCIWNHRTTATTCCTWPSRHSQVKDELGRLPGVAERTGLRRAISACAYGSTQTSWLRTV